MDNKAPPELKNYLADEIIKYQLVPLHMHRENTVEPAIGTFKDHLITRLVLTDQEFSMHLWDQLIFQAVLTLNLIY